MIESPCINYCKLNRNDVCLGCHRYVNEITDWPGYTDEEKLAVIERCKIRADQAAKAKDDRRHRYFTEKAKKK